MVQRITTVDELKGRTLEELLNEVATSGESLTVVLDEGGVVIHPGVSLEPLPELEGYIPEGWKDAIG